MASLKKITISNPDLREYPSTGLSQDVSVGWTTLNVSSTTGFWTISWASTYYYLIIGSYGSEKTEIVLASAKTDSTFTVSACKFSHSASDPVSVIPYNQVKFYGRTVSWGSNTHLITKWIDVTNQETTYEYSGSDYSYFIASFFREDTSEESGASDEITIGTFTPYSAKRIIEAGLRRAMTRADENQNGLLGWSALIDILNDGLLEIMTRKKQWQCLHKTDSTKTTTADVYYIEKPADLSVMEFLYVDGKKIKYVSKFKYNQLITDSLIINRWKPEGYTIKNDQIHFYPCPDAEYSTSFEYYSVPTIIDSLTQEVKKEFATILTYFISAQAAYIRNNEKRGNLMEAKFNKVLESQVEDVTWYEQVWESSQTELTFCSYDDFDI